MTQPYISDALLDDKFWGKVSKDCWGWTGATNATGYGYFGTPATPAHRVAWARTHGLVPDGMHVLHTCDMRLCVNPAHLYLGTHQDNMRDRMARGRQARGERSGNSKLTEPQVREMFVMWERGERHKTIAKTFGVATQTVTHILNRRRWKHVDIPGKDLP